MKQAKLAVFFQILYDDYRIDDINKLEQFTYRRWGGHLKNVSLIFAQMPDRSTNVEFTTVSPTIANAMLPVFFIRHSFLF